MPKIHKLKIEPMTEESFAPYGEIIDPQDHPSDHRIIAALPYHADGRTTLGTLWQPQEGLTFCQMERHFGVTQSFIQLSGSPAVVAVSAITDSDPLAIPEPDQIRAFLIDPNKGFSLKVGTWHSLNRYILSPPGASFAIINSDPNPTQMVDYQENYTVIFSDLDTDQNPKRHELTGKFGLVFEVVP